MQAHRQHSAGAEQRPRQPHPPPGTPTPFSAGTAAPAPAAAPAALPGDFTFCAITAVIQCLMLARATAAERSGLWVDLGLTLGGLAAMCLAPAAYAAPRVRLPFLLLLRARVVTSVPHRVDLLRLMTGHGGSAGAAAAGSGSALHRLAASGAASWLRASLLLFVAVGWLQACLASSAGVPLPPELHLPLLATTVAGLCWRAPAVCAAYVGESPANAQLTRALHWALRQVASLLLLGSRLALSMAEEAASTAELCVDVVWALEASLGMVLPTLIVWRAQLRAARQDAARRPGEAGRQLAGSTYERLCAPVLELVDSYGGATVPTLLAALCGYVAALLVRQAQPAAG